MMLLVYQTSRLYDLWFQIRFFKECFPYVGQCKTCSPGTAYFGLQGHNLNKLGTGPLGDAIYQISRLYDLWFQTRRFFFMFSLLKHNPYVKLVTSRAGPFLAPGALFEQTW